MGAAENFLEIASDKDKRDKLEAFQVLLRHILAVKYRTKNEANAEREFMGIHKNVNSSHDKIIFYMAFYLGVFFALL